MRSLSAALQAAVADALPRVLTLLDRGPLSPTRGSADRPFWHYRVDKDYPSSTYAALAWPLALLARRPGLLPGRDLTATFAPLALDAMTWWSRCGHHDGSHDEWFAYERSQVATAFTTFAVAEAALILGPRFAQHPERDRILAALTRAGTWLTRNRDLAVANHAAGAIAALANLGALLPDRFAAAAHTELSGLLALQDPDGFFPEYGGADPGYATVSLAYLGLAARRVDSPELRAALARLSRFAAHFIHPDGSYAGTYGRRGTRYAWLTGFALRAADDPIAAAGLDRLLGGLARGGLAPPGTYDDRYLSFFAFPDAVAALDAILPTDAATGLTVAAVPTARAAADDLTAVDASAVDTYLARAGLLVHASPALHVVAGLAVGGALQVYAPGANPILLYDDSGYCGRLPGGELVTSWRFPAQNQFIGGAASSETEFAWWSRSSPIERHPIGFRLFNRTIGRSARMSRWVAATAKRRFTSNPGSAPLNLRRRIAFTATEVRIDDRIGLVRRPAPERLARAAGFCPIHVPSAPLWMPAFLPLLGDDGPELALQFNHGDIIEVQTVVSRHAGSARLRVVVAGHELQHLRVDLE